MSDDQTGSITAIFQRLRSGETDSAQELWDRFFPRLIGLARKVLAGRELPAGAEDAVQIAFFNFFQRVEQGDVDALANRDDLWRLLSLMTAQIASKQRRTEDAWKRGNGKTIQENQLVDFDQRITNLDELLGSIHPPDCDMICEDLLARLDQDLREVAVLRLAGYSNGDIKDLLGYPLRSIERRMQLIRAIWIDCLNH
jgi:DNA-directed RNA polymerase specialized sigma24 family protein